MRLVVITLADGTEVRVRAFDDDDLDPGWPPRAMVTDWRRHSDGEWALLDMVTGGSSNVSLAYTDRVTSVVRDL